MPGTSSVIDVKVNLNTDEAMQSAAKLGEAIQKSTTISGKKIVEGKTTEIQNLESAFTSAQSKLDSANPIFNDYSDIFNGAKTALKAMQNGLEDISKLVTGGMLTDGMQEMFRSMYQTMSSSMEIYSKNIKRMSESSFKKLDKYNEQSIGTNIRLASATGLRAAADASALAKLFNHSSPDSLLKTFSSQQIGDMLPALRMLAERRTKEYQRGMRGTAGLEDLATQLANDNIYQNVVAKIAPRAVANKTAMHNLAKASILGNARLQIDDKGVYLAQAGFKPNSSFFVKDIFSRDDYKKAWDYYGRTTKDILDSGTGGGRLASTDADMRTYAAFRNLVKSGNIQAARLGKQVGLVRANKGYYEFSESPTRAQFDVLAGLAMQSIINAKTSLPFYRADRNDPGAEQRLINRQNKEFEADMEIIEILQKNKAIKPNIYSGAHRITGDDRTQQIEKILAQSDFLSFKEGSSYLNDRTRIKTLGNATTFVIPQTFLGKDGRLVYRNPETYRKTNGVQEQAEDEFVTIGSSQLTNMLGMYGHNTYGQGRDAEGIPIIGTPKLLKVNLANIFEKAKNEKTGKTEARVKPEFEGLAKQYEQAASGKTTFLYGAPGQKPDEYINVYTDPSGQTLNMMLKSEYDRIVNDAAKEGIANPLANLEVLTEETYKQQQKGIDVSKKKATPGRLYKELGFDQNPRHALVDFQGFMKHMGFENSDSFMRLSSLLDGAAIYDPSVFPEMNAQMRAGIVAKYMGTSFDWREYLNGSKLLERAYLTNKDRGLIQKNGKDANGNDKYSLFMPMVGMKDEEREQRIKEANDLQKIIDENEGKTDASSIARLQKAREDIATLRDKYFYDVMDPRYQGMQTDSTVKGMGQYRYLTEDLFRAQQRLRTDKNTGEIDKNWAVMPAPNAEGLIELTARQQEDYFQQVVDKYGLWINKTAADFRADKDFIPESIATAIHPDKYNEMSARSAKNYRAILDKLNAGFAGDENARIDVLRQTSLGRALIERGDVNGTMALKLIGSEIKKYEQAQSENRLFLPDEGVLNWLMAPNMATVFGQTFEKGFGVTPTGDYAKLGTKLGDQGKIIYKSRENALAANAAAIRVALGRNPSVIGEYAADIENIGDDELVRMAAARLGMDIGESVYTDPSMAMTFMTGDYDGDTAWIIEGLSGNVMNQMKKYREQLRLGRESARDRGLNPELSNKTGDKQALQEGQHLQSMLNFLNAQSVMGTSTAAIRNIVEGYDLEDPESWVALALAIDTYDRGTSEAMKLGEEVSIPDMVADASTQGALFRRYVKSMNAFANEDLNANPKLFSSRMPLNKELNQLSALAANFVSRREGKDVGGTFISASDQWLSENFDPKTLRGQAAQKYQSMMNNMMGGYRLANAKDIQEARHIGLLWSNDIEKRRRAGEDVTNEFGENRAYFNRLRQHEQEGLTQENNALEIERLEKARDELKSKTDEDSQRSLELIEADLSYRKAIDKGPGELLSYINEEWLKEDAAKDEEVQKLIAANKLKYISPDEEGKYSKYQGYLDRVLGSDVRKNIRMNWSDVTPWMYEVMEADKSFAGLSGIERRNLLTNETETMPTKRFNPYPHNPTGIEAQKENIMAAELDAVHGENALVKRYKDTQYTLMGSARHNTFQTYLNKIMNGETVNASDIGNLYEEELFSPTTDSQLQKLNLKLDKYDDQGRVILSGTDATPSTIDSINKALGTYNSQKGKYEGGSLEAFAAEIIDKTLASGGRITNVEGVNYQFDQSSGKYIRMPGETYLRGAKMDHDDVAYYDDKGNRHVIQGSFAPDLVLSNGKAGANESFTMYDYKSGELGSYDALYQMAVYAADIKKKYEDSMKADPTGALAKTEGWSRYIDTSSGTPKLKVKDFMSYDTSTGDTYKLHLEDEDVEKINSYYKQAKQLKLNQAGGADGTLENIFMQQGLSVIKAALGERFDEAAKVVQKGRPGALQEAVYSENFMPGATDAYRQYIVGKMMKDEEQMKDIGSFVWKQQRRHHSYGSSGYSEYSRQRKMIDEMLQPETINEMAEKLKDNPQAQSELEAYVKRLQDLRSNLGKEEQEAITSDFVDLQHKLPQIMYGVKDNKLVNTITGTLSQIDNIAQIREDMKKNKDYYDAKTGWKSTDLAEKAAKSEQLEKETREQFDKMIPKLSDRQIKENDQMLTSLIPKPQDEDPLQTTIDNYYTKRFDGLQQYIEQQEEDIRKYQNELNKTVPGTKDKYYKEGSEERKAFERLIENAEKNRDAARDFLNTGGLITEANAVGGALYDAAEYRKEIASNQIERNFNRLKRGMYSSHRDFFSRGMTRRDQAITSLENARASYLDQIASKQIELSKHEKGTDDYEKISNDLVQLRTNASDAENMIQQLSSGFGAVRMTATEFGNSISRVAQRLGRQMFYKVLNETKQFVKQFNASMIEIQAITLKTDEQMVKVRQDTLSKAVEMKTSVSNVATTEAALYRQGLSDEEVDQRTEDVIKFASVAGIKVEAATKILTTALQNNLVGSSEEAMDALVALGDNAATTADEIGKAMQKCAAAANVAGVSYAELTAMLTTMTSMTQLSGTQVGTAMNTILTRMRQVTTSKLTKDQNGEITTLNDVESALQLAGINLRDENDPNKFRKASDVLLDISKKWSTLNDVQKANITTSIAGTRMGNMFQTMMEGMSEDNGETFEKYLNLATDSTGITDEKYEIKMQGLAASMDQLKSSWDNLISGLESSGVATSFIDGITSIIQYLGAFVSKAPSYVTAIGAVVTALAALSAFITTGGGIGGALAATAAAFTIGGIFTGIGNAIHGGETQAQKDQNSAKYAHENYQFYTENTSSAISGYQSRVNESKKIIENAKSRATEAGRSVEYFSDYLSKSEQTTLADNLQQLSVIFPEITDNVNGAADSLSYWDSVIQNAEGSIENLVNKTKEEAGLLAQIDFKLNFESKSEENRSKINEAFPLQDIDSLKNSHIEMGLSTATTGEDVRQIYSLGLSTVLTPASEGAYGMLAQRNNANKELERLSNKYHGQVTPDIPNTDQRLALEYEDSINNELSILSTYDSASAEYANAQRQLGILLNELGFDSLDEYNKILNEAKASAEVKQKDYESYQNALSSVEAANEYLSNYIVSGNEVYERPSEYEIKEYNFADEDKQARTAAVKAALTQGENASIANGSLSTGITGGENDINNLKNFALFMYKNGYLNPTNISLKDKNIFEAGLKNVDDFKVENMSDRAQNYVSEVVADALAGQNEAFNLYLKMRQDAINEAIESDIDDAVTYGVNIAQVDDQYGHYANELKRRMTDALKDLGAVDENGNYDLSHESLQPSNMISLMMNLAAGLKKEGESALNNTPLDEYAYQFNGKGYNTLDEARQAAAVYADNIRKIKHDTTNEEIEAMILTGAGEEVFGDNSALSMRNTLTSALNALTDKDKGYQNQYGNLYRLGNKASGFSIDSVLSKKDASEYVGLFADDKELIKILDDVDKHAGRGKYSAKDLKEYIEKKYFGDTLENITEAAKKQYQIISDLEADLPTEMTESAITRVSETTGLKREDIIRDWTAAIDEYKKKIDELKNTTKQSVYDMLYKEFIGENGEYLGENGIISDDLLDQMNARIKGTGLRAFKTSDSKGFTLQYGRSSNSQNGNVWRYGLQNYSKQYTPTEMTSLAKRLMSSGKTWNAAVNAKLLSEDEFNAIISSMPEVREYMMLSEEQQQSQYGQNLKRDIDIKFNVSGIEELENAGKVAAGLSQEIASLQKGGTIALDVQLKLQTQAFEQGQQYAKLFNGSDLQKDEAAMAYLGMGATQYYADREKNLEKAQEIAAERDKQNAEEWYQRYRLAPLSEKSKIRADMEAAGYEFEHSDEGMITGVKRAKIPGIENANPYAGTAQNYSAYDLAIARNQILEGNLTEESDLELYNAAQKSGGEKWQQYQWLLANERPKEAEEMLDDVLAEESIASYEAERANYKEETRRELGNIENADTIAANITALAYGTNAEKTAIASGNLATLRQYQAAQYALDNENNTENRQAIASALGMDEKDVWEMMKSDKGKQKLKDSLSEQSASLLNVIAKTLEADLSGTSYDIKASMLSRAADIGGPFEALVQAAVEGVSEIATDGENIISAIVASARNQLAFDQAFSQAKEGLEADTYDYQGLSFLQNNAAAAYVYSKDSGKGLTDAFMHMGGWESDWNTIFNNKTVSAALSALEAGQINPAQFNTLIGAEMPGVEKGVDYYSALGQMVLGSDVLSSSGIMAMPEESQVGGLQELFNSLAADTTGRGALFNDYVQGMSEFGKVVDAVKTGNIEDIKAAVQEFNDSVSNKNAEDVTKYGNAAQRSLDKFTSRYDKMSKLSNQTARFNSAMQKLSSGAAKTGAGLSKEERAAIAERTNLSDEQLKSMGANMIKKIIQGAQDANESDWTDLARSMFSDLQDALDDSQELEFNKKIKLAINTDGSVDVGKVAEIVAEFNEEIGAQFAAFSGLGGTLSADIKSIDELTLAWLLKYVQGTGGTGTKSTGGGGGGGGKSAAQKAIADSKHKVDAQTHKIKMEQIEQQHLDKIGDYEGEEASIDKQISLQEEMRKIREETIASLEEQMASVEEYSDDWYSLRDAINEAKEALAELDNTIIDLQTAKIEIQFKEAENTKKRTTLETSMYSAWGRSAKAKGNFNEYMFQKERETEALNEQKGHNTVEIERYKKERDKLIAEGKDDNDSAINLYNEQIYALMLENAELDAQMLEQKNQMDSERIGHITDEFTRTTADENHENTMSGSAATIAQNHKLYSKYRDELTGQNETNKSLMTSYMDAITKLEAEKNQLEYGTEAWFAARDAVYQYEEALASLTVTIDENNRAIEQSKVNEIDYTYGKTIDDAQHNLTMVDTDLEKYRLLGDDENYINRLNDKISATEDVQKSKEDQLAAYMNLWNSGEITDQTVIDDLSEKIETLKEEIAKNSNELITTRQELNAANFKSFMEDWNREEANRQHNLNSIRYEETKYQNRGELTNYGIMLEKEYAGLEDEELELKGKRNALEGFLRLAAETNLEAASDVKDYVAEADEENDNIVGVSEDTTGYITPTTQPENPSPIQILGTRGNDEENEVTIEDGYKPPEYIDYLNGEFTVGDVKTVREIYDELMKTDEAIQKNQIDMEKLKEKIEQNAEAIRKVRETVENELDKEMKAREAKRREMLSAEVSIQNTILEEIKKRYREEWKLVEKDIQKRKEALNEEKKLLNERLQARKDAQKAEDKENELAELRRQYALISTDQSRTKDAQDLLRRIEEIEKEKSWDEADQILQAQSDAIDEQIAQLDEYASSRSENLEEMLKDNRLFKDEIAAAMKGKDEYLAYMRNNNENYKYATDESRQQMEQGWEDMWNKYTNTPVSYWDDIQKLLDNWLNNSMTEEEARQAYVDYMKGAGDVTAATSYKNSSEAMQKTYEYQWGEQFDKLLAAYRESDEAKNYETDLNAVYNVVSDIASFTSDALEELKDIHLALEDYDFFKDLFDAYNDKYGGELDKPFDHSETAQDYLLGDDISHTSGGHATTGYDEDHESTPTTTPSSEHSKPKEETTTEQEGEGSSGDGVYHYRYYYDNGYGTTVYSPWKYTKKSDAQTAGDQEAYTLKNTLSTYDSKAALRVTYPVNTQQSNEKYKKGGLVDYTGLAWVDGSFSDPEAFLSSTDTKLMRSFLDAFDTVSVPSFSSWDSSKNPTTNNSIGDVYVTINEAEINNDMDIQTLARQVGAQFTKELSKSGFTTANYAW